MRRINFHASRESQPIEPTRRFLTSHTCDSGLRLVCLVSEISNVGWRWRRCNSSRFGYGKRQCCAAPQPSCCSRPTARANHIQRRIRSVPGRGDVRGLWQAPRCGLRLRPGRDMGTRHSRERRYLQATDTGCGRIAKAVMRLCLRPKQAVGRSQHWPGFRAEKIPFSISSVACQFYISGHDGFIRNLFSEITQFRDAKVGDAR